MTIKQTFTVRIITKLLQWTKHTICIHAPGQRLEGDSSLSQEVCHRHSPWAGPAHNQPFSHKVFSTCLTQIPWCLALLNLFFLSPTLPPPCRCPAQCPHPSRHSVIPSTTSRRRSPSNSLTSAFVVDPFLHRGPLLCVAMFASGQRGPAVTAAI